MTRMLAKLTLYTLVFFAAVDVTRYRRRQIDRTARKEALMTWEEEGGSQPTRG